MMASIARVAATINAERQMSEMLELICREAHALFAVDLAILWKPERGDLVASTAIGLNASDVRGIRVPIAEPLARPCRCFRDRVPVVENRGLENPTDPNPVTALLGPPRSSICVPLVHQSEALGVLGLRDMRVPDRFTQVDLEAVTVFADMAAVAVANCRLREDEALIQRIASAISTSLELGRVMDTAARELLAAVGASRCVIALGSPEDERARARWEADAEGVSPEPVRHIPWRGNHLLQAIVSSREPLAIEDAMADPLAAEMAPLMQDLGVRSFLCSALFRGPEPMGILVLQQSDRRRRWTRWEVGLVQAVATQLAVAVENARLYEETDEKLRARVRELGSLLRLGSAVSQHLSTEVVMQRAAVEGAQALDADRCSIATLDPDRGILALRATHPGGTDIEAETRLRFSLIDCPDSYRMLARREAIVLAAGDPLLPTAERRMLERLGMAILLMVPLVVRERAIGAVWFCRKPGRTSFSDEDVALATAVAGQVAVAMENARLFQEVLHQKAGREALLQSMSEGVCAVDLDRRITMVNPAMEVMLGCRAEDMLGRSCDEVLRHTDEEGTSICAVACPLESVLQRGEPSAPSLVFLGTAWGNRLPTEVSMAPVKDEGGNVTGAVIVGRDMGKEWELSKLKANIISVVSHEFRTPLTSIIGFSELMLMRDQPAEERRLCLEQIHREGLRLEALVNDFLDVSRLDAGKVVLKPGPLDPAAAVERCISEAALRAGGRRLSSDVEPGLPRVHADPERLAQILDNLLSNAIKYSADGTRVTVRARAASMDEGGRIQLSGQGPEQWVAFIVEDQGVGIPADQLSEIFTPFHRVESEHTRRIRGTGLGLSIVRSLTELHGGKLWVESEVGVGSRFHVALRADRFLAASEGAL